MKYVDILKTVLTVDRLRDWDMHLGGITKKFNLFAVTRHNQDDKCAQLYIYPKYARTATYSSMENCSPNSNCLLQNENNKKCFVELLSIHFRKNNYTVHQPEYQDADTFIASTALDLASTNTPVTVVIDDKDILVLLVYHLKPGMADIL